MAMKRCPKCQAIIDSDDEKCNYCGYRLKKESRVVSIPEKDSFSIDGEKFDSFSGKEVFIDNNSKAVANEGKPYNKPAVFSPTRIRKLRWGYFVLMIVNLIFIGLGIMFLCFAISEIKNIGQTDVMLVLAIALFAFGLPSFIYGLVRFIQSFISPVLACELDAERQETRGTIVAEAVAEVAINVIGGNWK